MASFEELASLQLATGEQIEAIIRNYKKDSSSRKESVSYFKERLRRLDEEWSEFEVTDTKIRMLENLPLNHEYFSKDYYQGIMNLVQQYREVFEQSMMKIKPTERNTPPSENQKLPETSTKAQTTPEAETSIKLMRRQSAMMSSLERLLSRDDFNSQDKVTATKLWQNIESLHFQIFETSDDPAQQGYDIRRFASLEDSFRDVVSSSTRVSQRTVTSDNMDLPKIRIPTFDGNYQRWVEFKDIFCELVHNTTITDTKKMQYLTTSLQGEPKNLIKHLPAVGINYAAAWSIITGRYDNKRVLVSTLLSKLISQPSARKESASSIKSLHDITKECIHGLQAQDIPVQSWDVILVHIILQKTDEETQIAFEQSLDDNRRLVTIKEVLSFLERRFQSLEMRGKPDRGTTRTCASVTVSEHRSNCKLCKGDVHKIYSCKKFNNAEISQRWKWVKELQLCVNCLNPGHRVNECKSRHCSKCNRKHNTLLHSSKVATSSHSSQGAVTPQLTIPSNAPAPHNQPGTKISLLTNHTHKGSHYVLLGTARIQIPSEDGNLIECRAILDSGSQVNLITDRLWKLLGGRSRRTCLHLEGIGDQKTKMRHQSNIQIQSTTNDYTANIDVHILPKIVADQPLHQFSTENWGIPQNMHLADPNFNKPGQIDCLFGADLTFELLKAGQIRLGDNLPVLQNTVLGWVVAGKIESSTSNRPVCGICTTKDLEAAVSKFWEIEEASTDQSKLSEDEIRCESYFVQTTTRAEDGRFIVKLPLNNHPSMLADSKGIAYSRFSSIERRLKANPMLKEQYVSFMREYESLGHMTKVSINQIGTPHYFIPHHCVLRPESTSTKLRVVFDASAHNTSGLSLNDIMHSGPTVQSDLLAILLRFRMHKYILKTDVEKMYRQIWVDREDRKMQLILWRENENQPMDVYQLNTVTYGTRAAPYLATRCLVKLADDYQHQYPYGASSLRKDFYVDDGLIGADSIHEALMIQEQLIKILGGAGMKLKKWCSNHKTLLQDIAPEDQEVNLNFDSKEIQSTKTLGLIWLPKSDVLTIKVNLQDHQHTTKRTMSSDLAHIYDPLGLIGPVLVTGKIQLQKTWQSKLEWDENLPTELEREWSLYRKDLAKLGNIRIPRYISGNQDTNIEIHTFADASERAYGAAAYIRVIQQDKTVKVHLLCSKSRVAPVKQQTIPRLELCAALLASELTARVRADLGLENTRAFCWSDSQIVLSWLQNQSGKLPVYVAHRVLKILRHTIPEQWHHVPSKQNPADILSRGITPHELSSCTMWLYGPLFLYQPKNSWPAPSTRETTGENNNTSTILTLQNAVDDDALVYTIQSKNSFSHVQRVMGYVLRFAKCARRPKKSRPKHLQLSSLELEGALKLIIRQIQTTDFDDLKKSLIKDKFVPKTSPFCSLTPFLDEEGIIRVGGRLSASMQQFDAVHQMLLPSQDPIVKLLIEKIHKEHYHCGPQALLAQVRQRFWPIKGKTLARTVVQQCVRCTRARPIMYKQIMGNLPTHRVQPARPFLNSGVDYCGPFTVHFKTRGKRPQRAYLAVFCCFATKAVHLELVTELTTDAFIGALRRFIARRGHCQTLYCDNATNFVGARNKLDELNDIIYSSPAQESIIKACSSKGIDFQFIPPRSPHFGGLWEAAVKSAKHLLMKNVSTASLTYEELETVLIEIEAILNSRPLTPNSSDANDLNAITPAHFLIGEQLTSTVDVQSKVPKTTLQTRWQVVSQLKHSFWERWSKEYLNELQQRHKWKGPVSEIQPNTMVIIKEDNLPVLQWPLGRIINIYKGNDGLVRVCDVKTQKGIFKRPIHRLAPLFYEIDEDEKVQSAENKTSITSSRSTSTARVGRPRLVTDDETPTKRSRHNSTLLFTIVALLFLPIITGNQINVTKFNPKPGLYFEQIGIARRMSVNWKIIVYFNLEPYQQQINLLTNGIRTLQGLCEDAVVQTTCKPLLNYFDHIRDDLQAGFDLFSVRRRKRGAIDVVGNIAHSLFGVLDSNYEAEMSTTIRRLEQNDEYLEKLLKNQTSIIDSTINIIKKSHLDVQRKLEVNGNMIHNVEIGQQILTLSVQMFIITNNIQRVHAAIMDVLIDSHHDKINPLLLTPQQLNEEITKIRAHLPAHLQLPIHRNNLLEVYKLIKVNGIIAQDHAIFNIDLPLTDPREFQLMQVTPIAATINHTLTIVKRSTKFIAVSLHHDEFFPISQSQADACWRLNADELVCPDVPTTYQVTRHPMIHKCELDLLTDQPEPRCELHQLEDTTIWQHLYHSNQYMFSTINTIKLNAVCGSNIIHLTLEASGLITLHPECVIKNELITVQGRQQIVTSLQSSSTNFSPVIGLTKQYTNMNFSNLVLKQSTIYELETKQQELNKILETSLNSSNSNHSTHGMIVGYVAIALTIIAIIVTVNKCKALKNSVNLTTIPQPQTTEC